MPNRLCTVSTCGSQEKRHPKGNVINLMTLIRKDVSFSVNITQTLPYKENNRREVWSATEETAL